MRTDPDELFDVVDEADRVVRQERRAVVHRDNLLHRAVHVWLFNGRGELLLQMRSASKDQYPSTWTSSASGHLDAGESYADAAPRELREELGIAVPLRESLRLPASPETAYEFTTLYVGRFGGEPSPAADEVAGLRWWSPTKLQDAVRDTPEDFSPPLRSLLLATDFGRDAAGTIPAC